MSFVLTLLQVAMQESLVGVIISGLRPAATTAGYPAGQRQKGQTINYGDVSSSASPSVNFP
jgi:hypothetical protein